MSLELYYHPLASYCHKVLIGLYEYGAEFKPRLIDLGNDKDRREMQEIWPLCKFPVLRDHARQREVPESSIIIEYLDHLYPGKQPLIPVNKDDALTVRLWDRIFDNYVHTPMQEIVIDRIRGANSDLTAVRTTLQTAYDMINKQVSTRTWIAGEAFSLADCAAAPALFYASTVAPFPEKANDLGGYFERLVSRPSIKRVIEEAKPYFSMYPFATDIPSRFR